jgi:hypothetical protein
MPYVMVPLKGTGAEGFINVKGAQVLLSTFQGGPLLGVSPEACRRYVNHRKDGLHLGITVQLVEFGRKRGHVPTMKKVV